jgi:hypothetical protein
MLAQNAFDVCVNGQVSPGYSVINQIASAKVIPGVVGKITYICSFNIVNAVAQSIAIVEGTGTVCGTGTVGMSGGITPATGWVLGATAVIVVNPPYWVNKTATAGDDICILQSGTGQVSGGIRWVQQ